MSEPAAIPCPDDDAFTAFLERARPRALAFLRRLCAGGSDAEDVLQETLERVWRYRAGWVPSRHPEAWLLRAAFHTFVDHRRHTQRGPRPVAEPAAERPVRIELQEETDRALRACTRIERAVLVGFHRDGLTLDELAGRHGMPRNTIKSHLHRARRKLPGGPQP